jgi:hypothetical protein
VAAWRASTSPPSWAAQAGETVANAFRKPRETLEGWGKSAGEFFNNLKTGNIIGGVLGMVGAWLIGSMFAAGPFQIILSLLLLPLGFILGSHAAGASNDVAPNPQRSGRRESQQTGRQHGERRADLQEPDTNVAMADLDAVKGGVPFLNTQVTLGAPVAHYALLTTPELPNIPHALSSPYQFIG